MREVADAGRTGRLMRALGAEADQVSRVYFDLYAQALAKMERRHGQDLDVVRTMIMMGLIDPPRVLEYFRQIEPELYRYPAIDPPTRRRVEEILSPGVLPEPPSESP
jgi:hypothetical protein